MIRDFTADLRDFSFYLHHGSYGVSYGYPADFGQFTSGFRDFTRVFTCFLDYDLRRISNRFTSDFERLTSSFRDFNGYFIISLYLHFIYSLFHVGFK